MSTIKTPATPNAATGKLSVRMPRPMTNTSSARLSNQFDTTDGRRAAAESAATDEAHPETADRRHGRNYLWAELMRRSMALDVTTCLRCGGRLRLIVVIDDPAVVQRVLRHLGLPTQIPKARPVRAPPTDVAALLSRGSKAGWGCVG